MAFVIQRATVAAGWRWRIMLVSLRRRGFSGSAGNLLPANGRCDTALNGAATSGKTVVVPPYLAALERCWGSGVLSRRVRHAEEILCPPRRFRQRATRHLWLGLFARLGWLGINAFLGVPGSPQPPTRRNTGGAHFLQTIPSPRQCSVLMIPRSFGPVPRCPGARSIGMQAGFAPAFLWR